MTARDLLAEVERLGGRLLPNGDRLRVEAPEPLPDDLMGRLKASKTELLRLLDERKTYPDYFANLTVPTTEGASGGGGSPHEQSAAQPAPPKNVEAEKNDARQVMFTNYGAGHPDAPPAEPMPRPAEPWPADLNALLTRVSVAFEWSPTDVTDFRQWARRSPDGMADARVFLEDEAARLPVPGLTDRRRVVQERLRADPALRVAWSCDDDGSDPVTLVIAIRDVGTCELGVPRAKLDALGLPQLIDGLTQGAPPGAPAAA